MDRYLVTGNDFVSLPAIREQDGAVLDFTFLYKNLKGAVDVRGSEAEPFLRPFFSLDGKEVSLSQIRWKKTGFWIPSFVFSTKEADWECTYLAPVNGRGFLMHLSCTNKSSRALRLQWGGRGCWTSTNHATNTDFCMQLPKSTWTSWHGLPVFGLIQGTPLFVFSFFFDGADGERPNGKNSWDVQCKEDELRYSYTNEQICEPGMQVTYDLYCGLGFEAVSSITSGLFLSRCGYQALFAGTAEFLKRRSVFLQDASLCELLNYNLFFSYFFASGMTLDTEEFALMTSRSPRYYVSAAYWDRDSLLWNFPAILNVDEQRAKKMLNYVFTVQIRNAGIHSRFIDGTMLEPGFELDELCAPLIALTRYVNKTMDMAYLEKGFIREGVSKILSILKEHRHPEIALYDTMLYPSDDMHTYPYLTYDNALVEYSLKSLAAYADVLKIDREQCLTEAKAVSEAIETYCVCDFGEGRSYAWSTDLCGNYKFYDEPPGSLILLPFYGHCACGDPVYKKTVEKIYSADNVFSFSGFPFSEIGCAHNAHPWLLSFCNSLLTGRDVPGTLNKLKRARMDNGIACESVYEEDGTAATGTAFATCAGFLAYSLMEACRQ